MAHNTCKHKIQSANYEIRKHSHVLNFMKFHGSESVWIYCDSEEICRIESAKIGIDQWCGLAAVNKHS